MIGISIYDDKKIDTSSMEFKKEISIAIGTYLINNWNDCVVITERIDKTINKFNTLLKIEL